MAHQAEERFGVVVGDDPEGRVLLPEKEVSYLE